MLWAAFDFPRHPLAREDGERVRGAYFEPPQRWLRAQRFDELAGVIDAAHQAARDGAWVLGGLRYEAAGGFEAALAGQPRRAAVGRVRRLPAAPPALARECRRRWRAQRGLAGHAGRGR